MPKEKKARAKRPLFATLIALLVAVTLCMLGVWQLQRAEHKQQRLAQIQARHSQAPVLLARLLRQTGDIRDLPFQTQGEFDRQAYFLIDNRIQDGKVGYQVIAVLRTNSGLLLVNLGWVAGTGSRQQLPEIKIPASWQQLEGTVSVPEKNPLIRETAAVTAKPNWPVVLQQLDIELMTGFLPRAPLPLVMLLDPEHPAGFVRDWQPIVMPAHKHLAYAVQWFGLALACLLVYFFAVKPRYKDDPSAEKKY